MEELQHYIIKVCKRMPCQVALETSPSEKNGLGLRGMAYKERHEYMEGLTFY